MTEKLIKFIELSRDQYAIVDAEKFEELSKYKWHYQLGVDRKTGYAVRMDYTSGKRVPIRMHRQVLGFPKCAHIDHIDGDGINNQEANLRECTNSENQMNGPRRKDNTSGYKGVNRKKWRNDFRWCARIVINGKRKTIGYFKDVIDAAKAYDEAAKEYYGKFARLNFPEAE